MGSSTLNPSTRKTHVPNLDIYHCRLAQGKKVQLSILVNVQIITCDPMVVRLDGPVRCKVAVFRNLEHDIKRLRDAGARCLVVSDRFEMPWWSGDDVFTLPSLG